MKQTFLPKLIWLFVAAGLLNFAAVNATVTDLTGQSGTSSALSDALTAASDGDTILLGPGETYNAGYAFDKSVTIGSSDPEGDMPIVNCSSNFNFADGSTVDHVILEGLMFNGGFDDRYILNVDKSATVGEVRLDGCRIHGLRGVTRMKSGTGTLDEFNIDDCVVDSIKDYGVLTVDVETWKCSDISFTNSTFSKVISFVISRSNSNSVTINGCTLHDTPEQGRELLRWRTADNDTVKTATIKNTIIGHGWDQTGGSTYAIKGFDGMPTVTWSLSNNYATSDFSFSSGDIPDFPDEVYAGTSEELWVDPDNLDLGIADGSFAGKLSAGDPRWRPVIDIELSASAGMVATNSDAGSFMVNVPSGVTSVDLIVDLIHGKDPVIPDISGLSDGQDAEYELKVYAAAGIDSMTYKVYVHVQSTYEICYMGADSRGVLADAKLYDQNPVQMLKAAGYSVTFVDKNALIEWDGTPFDYTPYRALVVAPGVSSSNLKDFSKRDYPIPAVCMQPDAPRNDKWGWVNKSIATEMYTTKTYDARTAQLVVTNNDHYITANYEVDDTIKWTLGTADSTDWSGREVKTYDLTDSIPEAVSLARIPGDGNTLQSVWAVPAGVSVRSMTMEEYDVYERRPLSNNIVILSLFSDGLLYAGSELTPLLTRCIEWATGDELPAGTVSHWKLDEGAGTTVMDDITGATGEIVGNAAWIEGVVGKAVDFSNAADTTAIIVEDSENLQPINFTDGSFTVSLLARIDPSLEEQVMIIKGDNSNHGPNGNGNRYVIESKEGELRFAIDDDAVKTQLGVSPADYPTNQWAHIVGVRDVDKDTLLLYLNGIEIGRVLDGTGTLDVDSQRLIIGNYQNKGNMTKGALDDILIVDRALSGEEIMTLYKSYHLTSVKGAVSHWKLDEGEGTTVNDDITGATGEIVGNAAWIDGVVGKALDFSNAADTTVVIVEETDALKVIDFTSGSFTISLLARIDPSLEEQVMVIKGDNSNHGPNGNGNRYVVESKEGELRFAIDDDAVKTQLGVSPANYPTNQWTHIVGVRNVDIDSLLLYLNGVEIGRTLDGTGTLDVDSQRLLIGNYHTKGNMVKGALDDIQIINRAMPADEIMALWESYEIVYPSSDADLIDIVLDPPATLVPSFDKDVINYTAELPQGTTSVTVTVTKSDDNATVSGDGAIDVSSGSGTASIEVTAEAGNKKTYTIEFTVIDDIDNPAWNDLSVYPNPVQRTLNITNAENSDLSIYDLNGRLMRSIRNTVNDASIDVSDLDPGVYVLKIKMKDNVMVTRFVKK